MRTLLRPIRSSLSKRPLCFACGLFLVLLFLLLYFEWRYTLIAGVLLLALTVGVLLLYFVCRGRDRFGLAVALGVLIAATAAFFAAHLSLEYQYHRNLDRLSGNGGEAVIAITRKRDASVYSTVCEGKLISLGGEEIGLEGIFRFPYEADFHTGDRVKTEITLSPIREAGGDLSDCYSLSQGLYFEAEVISDGHLAMGNEFIFPHSLSAAVRDALAGRLRLYLPEEVRTLASALLLGDKSELSSELSEQFRHLGISHTLAVSGLHLGILLGSLSWLLKKLRVPRKLHLPILLPITLLYILTVGSASVLRAGGMLLILLFAHPFGRKRDSLTSLFATVTLICLASPFSVLDIGLLLSFFSTFGILLVGLPLCEKCRALPSPIRYLTDSLILTLSALTFTMPFSIFYFGEISLISPLANLIFVPLITLTLYLIPLLLILSPLPLFAATPAYALILLSKCTFFFARLLGSEDVFMLSLSLSATQLTGIGFILICIGLLIFRKTRPFALVCTLLFTGTSGIYVYGHTLETAEGHGLFAYSDGQNDALLLREGTRVLLCDHSGGGYAFLSKAIEFAELDPAVRVDALLLTHYHASLRSSLVHLLENSYIEFLILPTPDAAHADIASTLEERAERAGCRVRYYSSEDCLVGYHRFELMLDVAPEGNHPLSALTVSYDGRALVRYAAEGEQSDSLPLLPACHHAEQTPDASLWNRVYE